MANCGFSCDDIGQGLLELIVKNILINEDDAREWFIDFFEQDVVDGEEYATCENLGDDALTLLRKAYDVVEEKLMSVEEDVEDAVPYFTCDNIGESLLTALRKATIEIEDGCYAIRFARITGDVEQLACDELTMMGDEMMLRSIFVKDGDGNVYIAINEDIENTDEITCENSFGFGVSLVIRKTITSRIGNIFLLNIISGEEEEEEVWQLDTGEDWQWDDGSGVGMD